MARTFRSGFFSDPFTDSVIEHIAETDEITLFVGSGVSADQQVPTWASLLQRALAATLKAAYPAASIHIITTNYDELLIDIAAGDPDVGQRGVTFKAYSEEPPTELKNDEIPIVHIHGYIPRKGRTVRPIFSESDYVWWMQSSPMRGYVTQRFDRGTTLMIGASLRDYNIVTYLKQTEISQFKYLEKSPSWPKRLCFGTDDDKVVVNAFAARDMVAGPYTDGRWTHLVAEPIIATRAPYHNLPVGVVALSLHMEHTSSDIPTELEGCRRTVQSLLTRLGDQLLGTA